MITAKNYYDKINSGEIAKSKLPDALKAGFEFVDKVTRSGDSWSAYDSSHSIKKTIDLYFEKLQAYLESQGTKKSAPEKKPAPEKKAAPKAEPKERKQIIAPAKEQKNTKQSNAELVELVSLELKFIRRFVNMDGKKKDRNQIRLFINALQKAIREKRITKTSKFASEIMDIQDWLIKFHTKFNREGQRRDVEISEGMETKYRLLLGKQTEYQSVKFIKSYISLQGKVIETKKAKSLHNRIALAIPKKINEDDKYWSEISTILKRLQVFVKANPRSGILKIDERELNGLNGVLVDCGCEAESTLGEVPQIAPDEIVNSLDLAKMKFETLGFHSEWFEFLGDPVRGFRLLIYGMPKYGKSILALMFAVYLARNHGRVLYIASEEQVGPTLQKKVLEQQTAHINLDMIGSMPENFSGYDFVFIDSVNNYGLSAEDLRDLKKRNPGISLIEILQTTKDGKARGTNEYLHDADMIVEVYEKGKAVQNGRYNQGGYMTFLQPDEETTQKREI